MFNGKTVVITGGSSGIGKVLSRRFLDRGASLALMARTESRLISLKDELEKTTSRHQRVDVFPCDVSRPDHVDKAFQSVGEVIGTPDILVNSAGILCEGNFELQSLETFREIMDINFFGSLNCIKTLLPLLQEKGGGRIVNICSMAGFMGVFGYSAYCSSKHALAGLTHVLRVELKPKNIKVHLVCPPEFESPMVDELNTYRTPENREFVQTLPVLDVHTVADAIMDGIEKDRYEIIPGRSARFARRMDACFPSLSRKIVDYRLRKMLLRS